MAPLLIDNRGILKLGLSAAIVTALAFSGGFVSGYQQAKNQHMVNSEPLSLPVKNTSIASDIEQQKPEVVAVGEIIDVDQPDTVKESVKDLMQPTQSIKKLASPIATSEDNKVAVEVKPPVAIASSRDLKLINATRTEVTLTNNDILEKAKYSIQVGMYGRLINAEKMAGKLKLQELDAYVSDYINKKSERRFNVKFGYFADKKTAIAALRKYREDQKGDGYLVNFSVDDMTPLVEKNMEQVAKTASAMTLAVSAEDKIAGTTAINTSDILTKTLTDNAESDPINEVDEIIYN